MRDKDNDLVVAKANKLIQKYKYTLSKTEIRVLNAIISNINSPVKVNEKTKLNLNRYYNIFLFLYQKILVIFDFFLSEMKSRSVPCFQGVSTLLVSEVISEVCP